MLFSMKRAGCGGLICVGTATFSNDARARGGLQSGPVDAHIDGHWNATRPAGPPGHRTGFLFTLWGVLRNRATAHRRRGLDLRLIAIPITPRTDRVSERMTGVVAEHAQNGITGDNNHQDEDHHRDE